MKVYVKTVRCDVRLPTTANEIVENETRRTGIPKAVLLRSVILRWIEQEHGALPDANLAGYDQAAQSNTLKVVTDV